jgi:hypothetical protein
VWSALSPTQGNWHDKISRVINANSLMSYLFEGIPALREMLQTHSQKKICGWWRLEQAISAGLKPQDRAQMGGDKKGRRRQGTVSQRQVRQRLVIAIDTRLIWTVKFVNFDKDVKI